MPILMVTFKNLLPSAMSDVKTIRRISPSRHISAECWLLAENSAATVEELQSMSHLTVVPIWEGLSSSNYLEQVCSIMLQ
jgi:hypothetical protein